MSTNKAMLIIMDGWGLGKDKHSDAIQAANTPFIDSLHQYPNTTLVTCGEAVGLPDGQMGNSEVGHLNLGAGRVVYQDLVKINIACRDNSIMQNPEVVAAYEYAKKNDKKIHLLGLVSNGGVHSSIDHLLKFLDISKSYGIDKTFVHCFMDGRDTDPHSGKGFIETVEKHMTQSTGKVASAVGRYYAMDRDKRWERIKEAYDLLVEGKGTPTTSMAKAIEDSYAANITDEFIKPIVHVDAAGKPVATIEEGDVVIFLNFRNDRAKELTIVLTQKDMPEQGMHTIPLYYCTMTPYDDTFTGLHILFNKDNVQNTIGEVLSKAGLTQLRIAETEKYAHVTFFFSGGREETFDKEYRILVPSPKVATYDLQPEMSANDVTKKLLPEIESEKPDFICLNFANTDMVGHTGVFPAVVKAVETVDNCLSKIVPEALKHGYTILLTADHGNADHMINDDGTPNTQHSLNLVPLFVISNDFKGKLKAGKLADIAPTILKVMGIPAPKEMTGDVLIS